MYYVFKLLCYEYVVYIFISIYIAHLNILLFFFPPGVLCRADCLSLPYRDSLFDAVLFIGVIHHLVSSERQAKAIKELERVVRPGGSILIYAWAWEQEKRKVSSASHNFVSYLIRFHSCYD